MMQRSRTENAQDTIQRNTDCSSAERGRRRPPSQRGLPRVQYIGCDLLQLENDVRRDGDVGYSEVEGTDKRESAGETDVRRPRKKVSGHQINLTPFPEIGGIELKLRGLGYLLKTLERHDLLTSEQQSVLADISGMLNASIHGSIYNYLAVAWVLEIGPGILRGLDVQIGQVRQATDGHGL